MLDSIKSVKEEIKVILLERDKLNRQLTAFFKAV